MSYHHHHQSPPCCCSNTCFCCSSTNCCSSNSTPNPISSSSSSTSDLLLQTLLLIQSQSQSQSLSQPPPPPHPHHPIFFKPQPNKIPHRHPLHSQPKPKPKPKQHDDDDDDDDVADPSLHLLHSLIRRVAALESSLSKISPSPHQRQPQQRGQSSLKHAAAATIQRCFRRFLARRSRTLRDLNHLASIKSQAAALTSSLSDKTHLPKALSHRAMDLLLHLDSIQSSDPMIREGKRSVTKDLVRISEFLDKVLIREKEDEVEELERRIIDRARRVSFAAEENGDGDDDDNVFDDLLERNPEEEEVQGFYVPLSDDGKESPEVVRHDRFTDGGLGLAAPLPVKMEPRTTVSLKKVAVEEDY